MAQIRTETSDTNIPLDGEVILYNGNQYVGDGTSSIANLDPQPNAEDKGKIDNIPDNTITALTHAQYAAFNLIDDREIWRKAAKFTSTDDTAISATVKSTTGYCRIMNFDGTLEAVDGSGTAGSNISVAPKAPTSPFNTRMPKFYAIYPCDASGDLSGDLTYLYLPNNNLTTLDVSGLTALDFLYCYNNNLTTLDVSGLTALDFLDCHNNNLTTLDVSGLTALDTLWCHDNNLTTLDVSGLTALDTLWCYNNNLTTLDVTGTGAYDEDFYSGIDLSTNAMTESSLNAFFLTLPAITSGASVNFSNNPGAGTANTGFIPSNWTF